MYSTGKHIFLTLQYKASFLGFKVSLWYRKSYGLGAAGREAHSNSCFRGSTWKAVLLRQLRKNFICELCREYLLI